MVCIVNYYWVMRPEASNGLDRLDGKYINDSPVALTSLLNNEEFTIQAKALPFSMDDFFPLGLKIVSGGEYSIAIENMDGFFAEGQLVYLEDTFTATIHNLSESAYVFSSEAGAFNNRFILRFTDEVMSIEQPLNTNAIAIFEQDNQIKINAGDQEIKTLKVVDIQGRILFFENDINATEFSINSLNKNNQILIFQIQDYNNNVIIKKRIY
ncbi:hypothetical protein H9X57_06815 [Flavobacterium piscinae]|uniref:hypothetical protein n=1 Tax=Flavobacterium piscinae TaxID=2506424 RepID=UPI001985C7C3|nr:hypothetical protein [Flavobacterium piscinae]MBC8883232.1 hypothetical protein [Flavobacterium piscinae]